MRMPLMQMDGSRSKVSGEEKHSIVKDIKGRNPLREMSCCRQHMEDYFCTGERDKFRTEENDDGG